MEYMHMGHSILEEEQEVLWEIERVSTKVRISPTTALYVPGVEEQTWEGLCGLGHLISAFVIGELLVSWGILGKPSIQEH